MDLEQLTNYGGTVWCGYSFVVCDAFLFTKKGETCWGI